MRGPRKLEVVEVKSRQITIRWEPFGYNVTRCHSYNLTVRYCYQVGGQEQVREEVSWDMDNSHPQHTITNLSPYTNVSVKLILMNPEGRKESQELTVQTDEDRECLSMLCLFPNNFGFFDFGSCAVRTGEGQLGEAVLICLPPNSDTLIRGERTEMETLVVFMQFSYSQRHTYAIHIDSGHPPPPCYPVYPPLSSLFSPLRLC